tara:strand:+ start:353 stop:556 length:204 start_codon:yes stop_codon:yes gene_type:complete
MNARIKELAEQATSTFQTMDGEWVEDFDKEKFAELIILECANRASWAQDTGDKDVGSAVLKQFGVEE